MSYDHSTKIGNEGDLVKHAVLATAVNELVGRTGNREFVYAESHTGRAEYVLPERGAWRHGVGLFSDTTAVKMDRLWRSSGGAPQWPHLALYDDACVGRALTAGMRYPGSSGLLFRLLRGQGLPLRFHLWERDVAACDDLVRHYHPWPEVAVNRGDGYAGVTALETASLVLVDPPAIDAAERTRIRELLASLERRHVPFICWTACLTDRPADAATELDDSQAFHAMTCEAGWPVVRVRWPLVFGQTYGCQLTVSRELADIAALTAEEVCTAMGWAGGKNTRTWRVTISHDKGDIPGEPPEWADHPVAVEVARTGISATSEKDAAARAWTQCVGRERQKVLIKMGAPQFLIEAETDVAAITRMIRETATPWGQFEYSVCETWYIKVEPA